MNMFRSFAVLAAVSLILLVPAAQAQFAATGTTTVSVTVAAEAAIRIDTANTVLTNAAPFSDYTGTTNYTYKIRTGAVAGTGSLTLQVTSDFAPGLVGPSVASPLSPGDTLAYTCAVAAPGTACAGSVTSSTAAATSVASFGANARSAVAGNAGSVNWTLTNDPLYETGSYSATVTFTISAT
jgi:hypothetical protein